MRRLLPLLMLGAASPAVAQQHDHGPAGPQADPHAGHHRPAPDPHAGHRQPQDPHAGHRQPQSQDPHAGHRQPAPDPHAGHAAPQASDPHAGHGDAGHADPHGGHAAPQATDPQAGHDHADPHAGHAAGAPAPPVAPPPPEAFAGPAHAADLVYGEADMARSRERLREEHGNILVSKLLIDRIEARIGAGHDGFAWDAQFRHGGDIDRLWLQSEGEGAFGEGIEHVEISALWGRALDPWFDLQIGVRQDLNRGPDRTHLALGVQGLAPYWFEVEGFLFLSHRGELTARAEGEYDLRITQRLILQPSLEIDLSAQDIPELGIGAGLTGAEAGLRLRYEIVPEFAPYVGVHYERAFAGTARYRRAAGEEAAGWSLVLGLRAWF